MSQETFTLPLPTVSIIDSRPATSSLAIAEHFDKQHKHVLETIRELIADCPAEFNEPNFRPVNYTDAKGEKRPMYHVYFDGFILLVMGYTGKKALAMKLAYIAAFNALKEKVEKKTALSDASSLPPSEQNIIQALVKAIADRYPAEEQKRVYMQVWMRFRNHFKLGSYKQLPPSLMAEAVAYLANLKINEKKPAEPAGKQALPSAYVPLAERGKDTMAKIMGLRRDLSVTSMEIMDIMGYAAHHGKILALNKQQKNFADELSASVSTFFMCINHNMIAIEHMFKAFCEAEKLIYG